MTKQYDRERLKSLLGPAGTRLAHFDPPDFSSADLKWEGAKAAMNASLLAGMLDAWPPDHPFRAEVTAALEGEQALLEAFIAILHVNKAAA